MPAYPRMSMPGREKTARRDWAPLGLGFSGVQNAAAARRRGADGRIRRIEHSGRWQGEEGGLTTPIAPGFFEEWAKGAMSISTATLPRDEELGRGGVHSRRRRRRGGNKDRGPRGLNPGERATPFAAKHVQLCQSPRTRSTPKFERINAAPKIVTSSFAHDYVLSCSTF